MDNIMDSLVANEEDKKIEKLAVTLDTFVSSELCLPTVIYDKATDLRNELIRYLEHISNYEPKDEPTISKMEQVDEPQTDCPWRKGE